LSLRRVGAQKAAEQSLRRQAWQAVQELRKAPPVHDILCASHAFVQNR